MAAPVSVYSTKALDELFLELGDLFKEWARHNILLYEGDHWNQGEFWIGPRPRLTDKGYLEVMGMIERSFVSQNVVKEITLRVVNSLMGRQCNWTVMPTRPLQTVTRKDEETGEDVEELEPFTEDESIRIAEANASLVNWWDQKGILKEIKKALRYALLTKRGPLRFFIPQRFLDEDDALIQTQTLDESMSRVYLKAIEPDWGGVLRDEETMEEAGLYLYMSGGNRQGELSYAEWTEAPDEIVTILRWVKKSGDKDEITEIELPLGGRLMVNEIGLDEPLITSQVRQQQFSLNRAHTMMGRNADLGGFLERTVLNAQMPGHFEKDEETGESRWVPDNIQLGGSVVTSLIGIEETDAEGNTRHLTPSVIYRDPISPATFVETIEVAHFSILYEVNQAFASLNTKMASADSRRQSRADFTSSILTIKTELERVIAWVLEVALLLGSWGTLGSDGRYNDLKVVPSAIVHTGPLSAQEIGQIIALVKAQIWPIEKAMAETGVEDIDEAIALIDQAAKRIKANQPVPPEPVPPDDDSDSGTSSEQ